MSEFGFKINIDTELSANDGIEKLLALIEQLKQRLGEVSAQRPLEIVTEADIAKTEKVLEILARVQAKKEAGWQKDIAGTDQAAMSKALEEQRAYNKKIEDLEKKLQGQKNAIIEQAAKERVAIERAELETIERARLDSLNQMGDSIERFARVGDADVKRLTGSFGVLGTAVKSVIASLAAYVSFQGIKNLTKTIMDVGVEFDKTMQKVRAITQATDQEFQQLSNIAVKLGAETEFSTSQAAEALQYLAAAGLGVEKTIGALPGTMELATAGTVDLATAADITTGVLAGMGLEVSELSRVNDVLVYTMLNSKQGLNELGEAFKYVAPIAKSYGYDIETISLLLGVLANSQIESGIAGRAMRSAIADAGKVFEKYGEEATDSEGKVKSLIDAIDLLIAKNASNEEVKEIFGEGAFTSVLVLMNKVKEDSRVLRDGLQKIYQEAPGLANQTAGTIRDTLYVMFDEVYGALESISLEAFNSVKDDLKAAVTELAETIRGSAPAIREYAKYMVELAASAVKAGAGLVSTVQWLKESGTASGAFAAGVVLLAGAIGKSLIGALVSFIAKAKLAGQIEIQTNTLLKSSGVTLNQLAVAQRNLDRARQAGIITSRQYVAMTRQVNAAVLSQQAALTAASGSAAAATAASARAAMATRGLGAGLLAFAGGPVGVATLAIAGIAGAVMAWNSNIEENKRKLREQNASLLDSVTRVNEYATSLRDLRDELDKNAITLEQFSARQQEILSQAQKDESLSYSFRRIVNPTEQDLLTENLKNFESALLTTDEVLLKIFEDNERAFKKANTQVESFKNSLEVINQNTRGDLILGNRYVGMGRTLMSGDLSVYEDTEEALAKAEVKREEVLTKNQDAFNNYILRLSQIAVDLVKSNQISVDRADKIITEQVSKVNEIINKRQFEGTEAINLAVDVELLPSYRINSEQSNVKEIIKEETTDIAQLLQDGVNLINVTIDAAFEGITGKKLFDAQKMKEDAESAFRELNESVEISIRPLKEQLEELNKELKINLELDENQISSIESQIETLNNQILEMDRQRALAQVEIMADAYGRIAVLREEELKGAQLTEQEKVEAYKKGALAHIEAVNEAANNEINQQIATLQAVIDGCNQKIAQFASLAAAALMAGNAESYALNAKLLTGQVTELGEANAKLAEFQTQLAENNKKAEEAKNKILSFTGGGGIGGGRGGGGGGGSAKSAQDESLELAKVAAERAKWEAEEAAKDIAAAFKRGEVSINDYLQKALAARKEMYNADIAAAQEAVSKAEGAAAQAKAQLALDKALKGGAENTKEAYEEVFRAIEEAYNELIERLNGQSEAIRLKVDMGELTEAQGRDELKRAIEAAEPSLQNMITGMEELQAAAQAAGLDMDFTGPIARAETALWNLKAPLNEIARNINGMIGNAIEGLLTDIASGTMSLGDALRNFLSNIAKGLAEIAAQQIVASIMGAMGGPTGGIGGFISSIFGAFAEGGKVTGPGTGTSDSVLARLSNGEYVIRAKAVDYWGASFLEQINKMRAFNPKKILPKYAEGGPVGYIRNEVESYATTTNNLTKYLESRQESVFVDVKVKAEADKDRLIKMIVGDPSFTKGVMKTNKREAKSLTAILG